MTRPSLLSTVLFFTLIAGVLLSAQAPDAPTQTPQAPATQPPPQPVAIPAPEVVVRAEADNEQLRTLRSRADVDPEIEALARRVPEALVTRDRLVADSAAQDLGGLTRRALQGLRERWQLYNEQLDRWQGTLSARSQVLTADQEALGGIRAVWERTAMAAGEEGYPDAAVQTIGSVNVAVDDVGDTIRQRVDAVLTLQNRIAELGREAADTLARIDAAEGEARLGLLRPERPPLWTALLSGPEALEWTSVAENTRRDLDAIARFVEESAPDFIGQSVLLLILLVLMILFGRRAKGSPIDDPEIAQTAGLFARPVSATILIFLLTARLFYPRIPVALVDVGRVLGLIPLLRLLPMLLTPWLRRPVYVFAALWLLHALANLLPDGSVAQRLTLLVVTAAALAGFVWFLRQTERAPTATGGQPLTERFVRLGAAILALSLVANTLGFVDLAALLTNGTLLSVLFALAVFAGAAVIQLVLWMLLHTGPAQSIASVRFNTPLLTRRTKSVVQFIAVVTWLAGTLSGYDLLQPTYGALLSALTTQLSVGSLSVSLGNIVVFFLAIWLATQAARFTTFILEQDVYPRLTLPRGVPGAITKVSTYLIIGLGLVVAVGAAGIDLSNIALLAGALGVGIGFGLQNIVNNFVSGLILIFERPIQVGDSIQLDTLMGTVRDIGIRASIVRTFEGAEVLVPNADLIAGRVVNWTLSDRLRRIDISVGVAYGSDPHQVKQVLLDVAKALPDCLANPEPYVLFKGFGDSSLDFELRFWTSNFDRWLALRSDTTYDVHDALKAAGITIPFPQRDLHVKSIDPSIAGRADLPRPTHQDDPRR